MQTYGGRIDNLELPENRKVGTFMLYSAGIGTLSYVIAARFDEVEQIAPRDGARLLRFIAKLGADAYCDWSTVVDAPVSWIVPSAVAVTMRR